MSRTIRFLFLLAVFSLFTGQQATAAESDVTESNGVDILSKMGDSYYLDFKPIGTIPLPRILISDGVHFFMTTKGALESGRFIDQHYVDNPDEQAEAYPVTYRLANADGTPLTLDMSITKHLVWFTFGGFLVLLVFGRLSNKYKAGIGRTTAPRGAGMNFAEVLVVYLRDEVIKTNIGEKRYRQFAPYLLSCFFLILFMNLFGLAPWGVTPTADITVTAGLAICTFIIVNINGSKDYWKHIFMMPGVPLLMLPLMIVVEILGLFTKPFALAIRLFANMLSGKMLIYSMLSMIFIMAGIFGSGVGLASSIVWVPFTIFIYALKVFAAFLQAYIFTMFSALFIGMAIEEHGLHAEINPVSH